MTEKPKSDETHAHKYFSAHCFNRTWDLIDKSSRTPQEDLAMLSTSFASLWHWQQRKDVTFTNLSIAYWQLARVYALLRQVENARRFGQLCLEISQKEGVPPYYLGFAYESLARAELVADDRKQMQVYLDLALEASEMIQEKDHQKMLLDDLAAIK